MAISLEELALGALEGSAGPWTLAVGAGALAVALAAGSARPLRRMAATGAVTAQQTAQLNVLTGVGGWLGGMRRSWRELVAEARAEYEAGRAPSAVASVAAEPPIVLKPEDRAEPAAHKPAAAEPAAERRVFVVEPPPVDEPALPALPEITAAEEPPAPEAPHGAATRDRRGRFVRRQPSVTDTNGARAE